MSSDRARLLLTGSTGKIGRAWQRLLNARPAQTLLAALDGPPKLDLGFETGRQHVVETIGESRPDVVIHAAAKTDVDACQRDPAMCAAINAEAVDAIAAACSKHQSGLIFYSSDYVFDGSGPRAEEGDPAPLNAYGRAKADAERMLKVHGVKYLIVRLNVPLAPPDDGHGFYSFITGHLKSGREVRVVTDQWNNPLDTDRIVEWSWQAWQKGVRGILHLGGATYATRYDIARMIAEHIGADQSLIKPCKTADLNQAAPRPGRGGLLIAKQIELFGPAPDLPTILSSLPK